jgi:predicted pyridoxine 5'-phosphate oxidase superfamily flavin-nucleotide-binding protein
LILVDYAKRRRLKIWARASLIDIEGDGDLVRLLHDPGYRARVERAVVLDVVALDWNCPQHITPRFTRTEIAHGLADLPRGQTADGPAGSCGAAGQPPATTARSGDAFRNP